MSELKHRDFGYLENEGKGTPMSRNMKRRLDRSRRSREDLSCRSQVIVVLAIREIELAILLESQDTKSQHTFHSGAWSLLVVTW
jgi:hypothetical protein